MGTADSAGLLAGLFEHRASTLQLESTNDTNPLSEKSEIVSNDTLYPKLPPEMLSEILSYLVPTDLMHLLRVNKYLRSALLDRRSFFIWQESIRKNIRGFPALSKQVSPAQILYMALERHCHFCGYNSSDLTQPARKFVRSLSCKTNACARCIRKHLTLITRNYLGRIDDTAPVIRASAVGHYDGNGSYYCWPEEYNSIHYELEALDTDTEKRAAYIKHKKEKLRILSKAEAQVNTWLTQNSACNIDRLQNPSYSLYSMLFDEPEDPPPPHSLYPSTLDLLLFEPVQQTIFAGYKASGDLAHLPEEECEREEEMGRIETSIRDQYPDIKVLVQEWKNNVAKELLSLVSQSSLIESCLIDEENPTATLSLAMVVFQTVESEDMSTTVLNWPSMVLDRRARETACGIKDEGLYSLIDESTATSQARNTLLLKYSQDSDTAFVVKDRILLCEEIIPIMRCIIEQCGLDPNTATHVQLAAIDPLLMCMHEDCRLVNQFNGRRTLLRKHDAVRHWRYHVFVESQSGHEEGGGQVMDPAHFFERVSDPDALELVGFNTDPHPRARDRIGE